MSLEAIKPRTITSTPTYVSPKTKASDRFLELISDVKSKSPTDNELKFVDLDTKDEYEKNKPVKITAEKKETYVPKDFGKVNSFEFNMKTKPEASNFVNQVKNNLKETNETPLIEGIKNTKSIDDNFIDPKTIKLMSLKKSVNSKLELMNMPSQMKNKLSQIIELLLKSNNYINKPADELINDALEEVFDSSADDLYKQADLAFELLDLSFDNSEISSLQIAFFEKLREIVVNLDKSLREIQKQVEAKKKDSKVEIKIKRFDIKDLKKFTNKKVLL